MNKDDGVSCFIKRYFLMYSMCIRFRQFVLFCLVDKIQEVCQKMAVRFEFVLLSSWLSSLRKIFCEQEFRAYLQPCIICRMLTI